jgi:acyl carrier protein
LHQALAGELIDLFVSFSSISGVWGSGNQSAYGAANHFLDALGAHQRATGLAGHSISWGVWSGVGLTADANALERLSAMGLHGLNPRAGLCALERVLGQPAHSVVASVDWSVLKPLLETKQARPLLQLVGDAITAATDSSSTELIDVVRAVRAGERRGWLRGRLQQMVASVLGRDMETEVEATRGFFELGLDSLSALQLRRRIEAWIGMTLPPTYALNHPTIEAVVEDLEDRVPNLAELLSEDSALEELSEDDLSRLLAAELVDYQQEAAGA